MFFRLHQRIIITGGVRVSWDFHNIKILKERSIEPQGIDIPSMDCDLGL
jgi:hypothetical protein